LRSGACGSSCTSRLNAYGTQTSRGVVIGLTDRIGIGLTVNETPLVVREQLLLFQFPPSLSPAARLGSIFGTDHIGVSRRIGERVKPTTALLAEVSSRLF